MPDVAGKIASRGGDIVAGTSEEFAAFLPGDSAGWARLVKKANINLD